MDETVLKLRGMGSKPMKIESMLAPKECPQCGLMNKATEKFRSHCGDILDLQILVMIQAEIH